MRRIAIIGSGITGLAAAHGLLQAGFEVTLYSDRTAEEWMKESRPTGTAARFELALSYERELGLNFWDDVAPKGEGVFLTFCPVLHNPLVKLAGRFQQPFQAVDVRLQSARWMDEFERRGGRLIIEKVTVEGLEAIATAHDLTIVAAGRADLCNLYPRDEARSSYQSPQRHLAMVIVSGCPATFSEVPFRPVRFDFLGTDGEIFFIPYYHKDAGVAWNILVEAKPGSRMDRFEGVQNGEEVVERVRNVIGELFPWDRDFVSRMKLADPLGWLVGKVTPMVRHPSATLASGRVLAALGDTAISYDPIAAQGANSGIKQARHLVREIVNRGNMQFDQEWVVNSFEAFYQEHANRAVTFSNLLLEPLTAPAKEMLIAQYGSTGDAGNVTAQQGIANAFVENFNDPRLLTSAFTDLALARGTIANHSGGRWFWNSVRGRASIAGNQVRLKLTRRSSSAA